MKVRFGELTIDLVLLSQYFELEVDHRNVSPTKELLCDAKSDVIIELCSSTLTTTSPNGIILFYLSAHSFDKGEFLLNGKTGVQYSMHIRDVHFLSRRRCVYLFDVAVQLPAVCRYLNRANPSHEHIVVCNPGSLGHQDERSFALTLACPLLSVAFFLGLDPKDKSQIPKLRTLNDEVVKMANAFLKAGTAAP